MYGRRTRLSRRPRGRRSSRGRRSVRRIAWRTALATHEGTRISRICDRTLLPPTGNTDTVFKRWDPAYITTVQQLWETNLKPADVTDDIIARPYYSSYFNWRLPEFYAFRDGLHLRGRYDTTSDDYFLPVPGPTPFGPHTFGDLNDDGFDMAKYESSKAINISPGTMWNLYAPYSGIQRGEGRGMREGTSIRSMKLSVGVTLTPAVIDVPVVNVPDANYLLPNQNRAGTVYSRAEREQQFRNSFNGVLNSYRTSYVVPTWATVILFSYRKDARSLEVQDPDASLTKSFDRPYVKANPLYWVRNRHRRVVVDEFGNRVMEPAERWAGHDQPLGPDGGGTEYSLLGGPTPDGVVNLTASADWTVPSLKQRRILYPSDIEYDKSVVKIHKIKTVRFNQPTTVIHDSESSLQPRWITGRQFSSVLSGNKLVAPTGAAGSAYPSGTVGSAAPPTVDTYGNMTLYDGTGNEPENPGVVALQKPPNVKSANLRFQFNFNGERIEFDDTQDDDRAVVPAWVVKSQTQPNARQAAQGAAASTTTLTADLAGTTVLANSTSTNYALWAVGSSILVNPAGTNFYVTSGEQYVKTTTTLHGSNLLVATQQALSIVTGTTQGVAAAPVQPVVAVKKWQHYGDNTPLKNLYMTVITPCYKWPVRSVTQPETEVGVPCAFAVPNWGSAPVKVEVGTSFWFKK